MPTQASSRWLAEIAAQEGFVVSLAHSLAQARAHLADNAPDLVVIDLMLPDGDGIGLLRDLKDSSGADVMPRRRPKRQPCRHAR